MLDADCERRCGVTAPKEESPKYTKLRKTCEDPIYIRNRNMLIPQAMTEAFKQAGLKPSVQKITKGADPVLEAWYDNWNAVYLSEMDALAFKAGLTGWEEINV
jgi:hypothetical protein